MLRCPTILLKHTSAAAAAAAIVINSQLYQKMISKSLLAFATQQTKGPKTKTAIQLSQLLVMFLKTLKKTLASENTP